MSKLPNQFRRKQRRTAILLTLLILGCVGAAHYLKASSATRVVAPSSTVVEEDINTALERYHNQTESAELVTETKQQDGLKAKLLIYGTSNVQTAKLLVEKLKTSQIDATFFLSTVEASSAKEMVSVIRNAGYAIGVLNDGSSADLTGVSGETTVSNLSRAGITMQAAYGAQPSAMLTFQTLTEDQLRAAKAAYIDTVYVATETLRLDEITGQAEVTALVNQLRRGSLLGVRITSSGQASANTLGWVLEALTQTDLQKKASVLVARSNGQELTKVVQKVYTTERAASFTFSSIGDEEELGALLKALKEINAKALFYVTNSEAQNDEAAIRSILEAGHDLGIGLRTNGASSTDVLEEILLTQETILSNFGYDRELPIRQLAGSPNDTLLQAATAGGFKVLSSEMNATQQSDLRATDAAAVLEGIFPVGRGTLQRGEIVHFQMNLYQQSKTLLGELVTKIAKEKSVYAIRSVMDVLNNDELTYTYPVPADQMLPEVKDKIYPGQLTSSTFLELKERYIGIDWVDSAAFLPGFTKQEISRLDKKGLVSNDQNMVFLTFDDWGTDATITTLLDVLKRHNAKATFFVRTSVLEANPNLLRAIAMDGHAVGSHTNSHFPLSNETSSGKKYTELTDEQALELQKDLVLSYQKLQNAIGDVKINGRAALCRIFRPPTLAMSKKGLQTVLDCGFQYSVSAYYTAQDYQATSAESLAKALARNTKSGSVIIMHMSDNCIYTAEGLEMYLSNMEVNAVSPEKTYKFCTLPEGLLPDEGADAAEPTQTP